MSHSLYLFSWQAVDDAGELHCGDSLSSGSQEVLTPLVESGLQPIVIKKSQRIGAGYWKNKERIAFIRQLATLLQTGLPLTLSLNLLAGDHPFAAWRCVLAETVKRVNEGQPLSAVMLLYPQVFPAIYPQIIAIGELTGQLESCCEQLAVQQEQVVLLQKRVKKALRYPLIVMAIATGITLLMLTMVLPEFAKIYASFDAELPGFTQMLITASEAIVRFGPALTLLIVCGGGLYFHYLHPQETWQRREQGWLLRLPLVKKLISDGCLCQLFQTLVLTQHAGMTLSAGLSAAESAISNLHYKSAVGELTRQLAQGIPLHKALSASPRFPALCRQLVKIGEESGSLDTLLQKLAHWHAEQANELADNMAQKIEPLMMLFMGIVVGGLVIAMYLPIFNLGAAMN
ncbi:protein transport protein HofC [Rouxiella badensis]|uniref:protein transport protein HofC n=1 Tax=Rouxiella badensis TaxID=1646377 RepID=UPI001D14F33E|nr:protein transport protein HofC [Rouxiella badensis]MCC3718850.1 protein transport protein HofC [Rouxiella badensis]MCC3727811.1 protein transport protein HofC [Rouxiella badensis]MCC3733021.1 protein transport protein HofC [Rouxiella badensis]MCC3739555.1 protein transport protein HofC [Rouxiella badensis]MCC3757533.1 protein transport protein HofC [Rouxiella badensis]